MSRGTSISIKQLEESSLHAVSSGDERWFPVFDWRDKPTFHKHLKPSFPSEMCMWEGPCVFRFKWNGPWDALTQKKSWISLQSLKCKLIFHITRWKDVWITCRDPTESPTSPPHGNKGTHIPLTPWEAREFQCFKSWQCLKVLEYC